MRKPTLLYFVHAHGAGHRSTFGMLFPELERKFTVVALTTNADVTYGLRAAYDCDVVELPPKYPEGYIVPEHTFSKPFEVTPYAPEPAIRARALAETIMKYSPVAFVCDGVPEFAIMVRGMGVPVVLVHLPGNRSNDPTQVFAYQLADHIIAHFPKRLEQPDYQYGNKTVYAGYVSKYAAKAAVAKSDNTQTITVLCGSDTFDDTTMQTITSSIHGFVIIGNTHDYPIGPHCRQLGRVKDIEKHIASTIVISAAGQNTVAELLSLHKTVVLLPENRPYDEQQVHAEQLARDGAALMASRDFNTSDWTDLLRRAEDFTPNFDGLINPEAPRTIADTLAGWYANK